MNSGVIQRAEAARVIDAVVNEGRSLDSALALSEQSLQEKDRPLVRMLCYGVLRNHYQLRSFLRDLVDKPLKSRDRVIECLIIIGFHQISDTRVPDHAAVSMTVDAVALLRKPKFRGLVNAVLRNFIRRDLANAEPEGEERLFNHPTWLLQALKDDWPDHWKEVVAANNLRAPLWLRVNARHTVPESWLRSSGLKGQVDDRLPAAVRLDAPVAVTDLPGFADGVVSVQDGAAQIAAPLLLGDDVPRRVLDACAAPGGKTGHLLELLPETTEVTAIDIDTVRLERVRENLDRLNLTATLAEGDASKPEEWWDETPYDRILVDAPCSATGVIRRHPDIRLLRRASDFDALAERQIAMLTALWQTLAPAGRLLYVTCSVLSRENDAVVRTFLDEREDAREVKLLQDYNIRDLMQDREVGYQVLPGTNDLDGFYFAVLEKVAP